MKLRISSLITLGLCLTLGHPATAAERPPSVVTAAVADFVVTGYGEPRYWLGYVYSEVLARRLYRCPELLVIEPVKVRQQPLTVMPQDLDSLAARCLALTRELPAPYVFSGLIEDQGATLKITCLVAAAKSQQVWPLTQEVAFSELYQPQIDLVAKRILPNMGVRVRPEVLEAMASYDPGLTADTMALVGQGWRAYAPQDPSRAFSLWQQAQALDPGCALAAEAEAAAGYLYRRYLLDKSLSFYQQQVNREPDDALAHFHLGEIYSDLSRWHEAEREYETAMRLRNTYLDAYVGLAQARLNMGDHVGALQACEGALSMAPTHLKALHNKAVALYQHGMITDARLVWEQILTLYPEDRLAQERLNTFGGGMVMEPVG